MGVYGLYEAATPYNAVELAEIDFDQTNDSMYTVHIDKPPQKVQRYDHDDWRWSEVVYGPTIDAPTSVAAATGGPTTGTGYSPINHEYVVTSISSTGKESRASIPDSVSHDLTFDGAFVTITWAAEPDAVAYIIYKGDSGSYGYIGTTGGLTFKDQNIIADMSNTPPTLVEPFAVGNYPSSIAFHGQRLNYGRSRLYPNGIWGSRTADFENHDKAFPTKADDGYFRVYVGRRANEVNQLLSTTSLLAMTSDRLLLLEGLTATNFEPKPQVSRGASRLKALEVDETIFYKPVQGSSIRTLGYRYEIEGFQSNDISIFSSHLFKNDTIKAWAYQAEPSSVIWAVMTSGRLLAFTWQREQEVWGWAPCETEGFFEDVAVITEGAYDRVYFIVRREIGEETVRFYERLSLPHDVIDDACPVDCAVTQSTEDPTNIVTGLWHLEGMTVNAYSGGFEYEGLLVEGGQVTLPEEVSYVSVGLPFTSTVNLLPLALNSNRGSSHTNIVNYAEVVIRTIDTAGLEVRSTGGEWQEPVERDPQGSNSWEPAEGERDYSAPLDGYHGTRQSIEIRQTHSLPWQIIGVFAIPVVSPE